MVKHRVPRPEKIEGILIPPTTPVKEAMGFLNRSPFNVVFAVTEEKEVVGCITDGDVRRGLLNNVNLNDPVDRIMRRNFIAASEGMAPAKVLDLIRGNGVRQIPVLNERGKLVDVYVLEDFIEDNNWQLPVIIMAGGRGTRLRPFTENTPKPLLKVGDRSVIERIVQNFVNIGAQDFFVTVNYLAEQVENHLGDGSRFGANIRYVREPQVLGTAGSLSLLRDDLKTDFLVVNGDMLTNVDLKLFYQFHQEHQSAATVCSKIFTVKVPYGVLKTEGKRVLGVEEKPDIALNVSSGIYLLSPKVLQYIDVNETLDMPHLIDRLIRAKLPVHSFQSVEPWLDIGSHEDFAKAQKYLQYLTW